MLVWRLLLGTVFVIAIAVMAWVDYRLAVDWSLPPGLIVLPTVVLLALAGANEVAWLLSVGGLDASRWVVYAGSVAVVLSSFIPRFLVAQGVADPVGAWGWPAMAFAGAVILGFGEAIFLYEKPGGIIQRLALGVLTVSYIGALLSFLVQLRWVGPDGKSAGTWGMVALISLLMVVKMGDIGAYTVGRICGRTKLAPRLSPGKTIEGAIGGLVFACLGSYLVLAYLAPFIAQAPSDWVPPGRGWLLYGLAVGGTGMVGDLAESMIKRDMGTKDSSLWLPGFGGVLDLLDSVLLAAPVAYLFWGLRMVGP